MLLSEFMVQSAAMTTSPDMVDTIPMDPSTSSVDIRAATILIMEIILTTYPRGRGHTLVHCLSAGILPHLHMDITAPAITVLLHLHLTTHQICLHQSLMDLHHIITCPLHLQISMSLLTTVLMMDQTLISLPIMTNMEKTDHITVQISMITYHIMDVRTLINPLHHHHLSSITRPHLPHHLTTVVPQDMTMITKAHLPLQPSTSPVHHHQDLTTADLRITSAAPSKL